ncbi:MAG: hypothetical protein IPL82_00060 [Elusimicrobia bacterium]|nr:hypothetical protein [Elusimicrobiota bacterium]
MKPKVRTGKLGRKKPKPRFPIDQKEYEAVEKKRRAVGGKYYSEAILETKLGTLSVQLDSGRNIVTGVNHQALKPEHFGLEIQSYIMREINEQEVQGWADDFRANA